MKPKKALIVYKKSFYEKHPVFRSLSGIRASHDRHRRTLRAVKRALRGRGVRYDAVYRTREVPYGRYDLIIPVGGDGTFLEAARRVGNELMLGVNSDPDHSVGIFCAATGETFARVLGRLLDGRARVRCLTRLAVRIGTRALKQPVLNDVLFCHRNPAAMSRYWIAAGGRQEQQRSSGVWVATAAGSTGGIHSAGGRRMGWGSRRIQYHPRELYDASRHRLRGGSAGRVVIGSLMRDGMLYVDGSHRRFKIPYGGVISVSRSLEPLKIVY
ncbi:MAG: hypothetical protein A3D28_03120 [Omnitrophica bacterium RIFCSPHIGHO2_02_FULL_63_14]|nr:MAG: hypothetical protein A3D28_03120 [Omnitrophica bacterium RIFCSPHIGHO2_02_FULL_63_14]